ncbi:hypothetical protein EYF80_045803 [Liparis tanakae]|uniref:Uncharacterized protein n=1 Tax=Liparis tanakae TaxID=230148 RepID=A0A4Z2FS71_9TELE|nr:hypothetical protein EYF80_045803 [Liparis tanakae]
MFLEKRTSYCKPFAEQFRRAVNNPSRFNKRRLRDAAHNPLHSPALSVHPSFPLREASARTPVTLICGESSVGLSPGVAALFPASRA